MSQSPSLADYLNTHLGKKVSRDVAHYTPLSNLPNLFGVSNRAQTITQDGEGNRTSVNLGLCSLWATPVQFLNDRDELALGLKILLDSCESGDSDARDLIEGFLPTPGDISTDVFQVSFSGKPDDLGQWRGYGDDGHGCSIVVDSDQLEQLGNAANWVIYDEADQKEFARKVLQGLRDRSSRADKPFVLQVLLAAACFMKNEAFSVEEEFRVIRFCSLSEARVPAVGKRLAPYVDVVELTQNRPKPKGIYIGPAWQLADLDPEDQTRHHVYQGVMRTLALCGLDSVISVKVSRGRYDPR